MANASEAMAVEERLYLLRPGALTLGVFEE
jgi:hypothetical protein